MANIYVLTRSGQFFNLVYHFSTPAGNNSAGVSWATALINSKSGGTTILPDGDDTKGTISAAEKSAVAAGTRIETVVQLDVTQGGVNTTLSQVTTYINAHYAAMQTAVFADLQAKLQWFGGTI